MQIRPARRVEDVGAFAMMIRRERARDVH